jgi:hypothetical protein
VSEDRDLPQSRRRWRPSSSGPYGRFPLSIARHGYHRTRYTFTRFLPMDAQIRALTRPRRPVVRAAALDTIRLHTRRDTFAGHPASAWAIDGGWDVELTEPRRSVFDEPDPSSVGWIAHEAVRTIFVESRHHRSTQQYALMMRAMEAEQRGLDPRSLGLPSARGCRTRAEIDLYFERLQRAFDSMRRLGYLTQRELGLPWADEAQVYVTRNGAFCKRGGANHRFLMAEVLHIERVPFVVAGFHVGWVRHLCHERTRPHRAVEVWLANEERFADLPLRR